MFMLIDKVLTFWFGSIKLQNNLPAVPIPPSSYKLWFNGGVEVDLAIKDKFFSDFKRVVSSAQLQNEMMTSVQGAMTLIILFDQFTRNMFRNTQEAFSYDSIALKCAQLIHENKWDLQMNPVYRGFAYLPFEHSEDLKIQETSVQLFSELRKHITSSPELEMVYGSFGQNFYDYAILHYDIIKRFGRYPHRNYICGRTSTLEETEYLTSGANTFGVAISKDEDQKSE